MPVSRKRKRKNGAVAKYKNDRRAARRRQIEQDIEDGVHMSAGVSLQELINLVAYQEYQEKGLIDGPAIPDNAGPEIDMSDPATQSIIRAVHESDLDDKVTSEEENEDGR